jgi:chromosomal replication initiator protein
MRKAPQYISIPGLKYKEPIYRVDKIDMDAISELIAQRFRMPTADLKLRSRKMEIVIPRYIAMKIFREYGKISLVKIATHFNMDHTTVMHGIKAINDLLETEPHLNDIYQAIMMKVIEA